MALWKYQHLHEMAVGETCWTLPWAVLMDYEYKFWLDLEKPCQAERGGVADVQVTLRESGWYVDMRHNDTKTWTYQEIAGVRKVRIKELLLA